MLVGLLSVLFFKRPPLFLAIVIVLLLLLFLLMTFSELRKFLRHEVMYEISEAGIRDLTNPAHVIDLAWSEVMKLEEVSNNSSLQIGIFASQDLDNHAELAQNMRVNMMRNGNHVFYNIMIDGFQFRKKKFQKIWTELKKCAQAANSEVIVIDYVDPILKKKRK
ncbi:hypothetical protein OfM2_13880 [Lactovum odontotermitis]